MQVKVCRSGHSYSACMRKVKLHKLVIGRRGLAYSLGLCMLILGIGGLGFWVLEPRAETYSDGLWLAFTTAAVPEFFPQRTG
jgi:voltage-gated potassium channel